MNDELKALVWQVCRYLKSDFLKKLSDDELTSLFQQVFGLQMIMQNVDSEPVEQQVVAESVRQTIAEIRRRGLRIRSLPIEVVINANGEFVKGKDELRYTFSLLSFDNMMEFIDSVLSQPLNDAQRKALLDLAYEKVYADSAN
ncbi:MAG: hypothetical protein IJ770_05515 [Alphaproteobacteria bacterium]|nr:hypothetical protein [Alphaproteobacteria bacterium]